MNANKKIIEGLTALSAGLNLIIEGLSSSLKEPVEIPETPKSLTTEETNTTEVNTSETDAYTEEDLASMSYNDLKKLAKDMGITATGNRKELLEKLSNAVNSTSNEEESETEDTQDEAPKKSKTSSGKKLAKKQPEPDDSEDDAEDESEEEAEEPDEETTESKVEALTEDMSDDELKAILESVGVSTKGKRQALLSKIIKAVDEGILPLDEEESEDEESDETSEAEESEESLASAIQSIDTEGMTKKRRKAFEEVCNETCEQFESGDITREDIAEFISAHEGDKFDANSLKKKSDEDLVIQYLEAAATYIDDEGNTIDEEATPYYINEEPYCCGHPLTYNKKKKAYVCEYCGTEYDDEDDE